MPASERPKALIPLLIVAAVLVIAAIVAGIMLLGRPGGPAAAPTSPTPSAAPSSPAATPSSTPTPTPTPSSTGAAAASNVTVDALGFDIVADDGSTIFAYEWPDDAAPAVEALTAAFGDAPEEGVVEGDGTHFPDYSSYSWGGFQFLDMIPSEGGKARAEYFVPSYVILTSNSTGAVTVTPEFDLAIGLSADEVRALGPDEENEPTASNGPRFFFATERQRPADDLAYEYSAWVDTDPGTEEVTTITYRPYSEL
ncbi:MULTISPECIES: hypothetical protein [unclassified Microbacterium]|uniref:hypothetical protein n=1 Tax=unclassified Microbacterium TaxID=2609290 RepID=UPI00386D7EEA